MTPENSIGEAEGVFREMYRCMLGAEVKKLAALLDAGFTLTHMTGLVQPRADWLAAIRTGRMAYHAAREVSLSTVMEGNRATVVGRHMVDTTIFGSRGTWPLQLTAQLVLRDDWVISKVVATTFRQ